MYADEVFVLNTAVNYLLLRTATALTGGETGRLRLAAGAVLGGLYAAAVLFPALEPLGRVPFRILAYGALCGTVFGLRGRAWRSWLWFFGVCCGFGGLVLAATALLRTPVLYRAGRIYYRVTGRLLVLLAAGLYAMCRLCLDRFARHRGRELVRLELELRGRRLTCTALRDNGNTLREPVTGQPVLVARWQLAARLLPELGLRGEDFARPTELLVRLGPALGPCLVPYRAVGTAGGMLLALRMDRITLAGRPAGTRLVAFSPTELSDGGVYEALCQG